MRLIDADRLFHNLERGVRNTSNQVFREIANTPTVKAIPIEWFKKKIDWHLDNVIYGAEVYQWVLNRWYEDKENWERENEID